MEELYYLCSENKGADQLRNYCAADLCLCFRICKEPVFSQRGSFANTWPCLSDLLFNFNIKQILKFNKLCKGSGQVFSNFEFYISSNCWCLTIYTVNIHV